MDLKLSDKQKTALVMAYQDIAKLGESKIQEVINPKITKVVAIINEQKLKKDEPLIDIESIKMLNNIAEEEAQITFRAKTKSIYFKTVDEILKKLEKDDFVFSEKQVANIKHVSETYAKIGMGQLSTLRELFSNMGNVDVGEFTAFANVLDKSASKIDTTLAINNKKLDENFKINYDIHQVLRNHLAWKNYPEGGSTIEFNKPKKYSKEDLLYIVDEEKPNLKAQVKSKGGKLRF